MLFATPLRSIAPNHRLINRCKTESVRSFGGEIQLSNNPVGPQVSQGLGIGSMILAISRARVDTCVNGPVRRSRSAVCIIAKRVGEIVVATVPRWVCQPSESERLGIESEWMTDVGRETVNMAKRTYKVALAESSSQSTFDSLTTDATSPLTKVLDRVKKMIENIAPGGINHNETQKRMVDSKE